VLLYGTNTQAGYNVGALQLSNGIRSSFTKYRNDSVSDRFVCFTAAGNPQRPFAGE